MVSRVEMRWVASGLSRVGGEFAFEWWKRLEMAWCLVQGLVWLVLILVV